ncbi:NAD(P)-binding protein [Tenacibaculum sp. 190524A05c]|uniref:flavin monoamine oxidase family protein n=1 Tax=Tenacibaculum platacis TaxID=3137852 RepID=UPI0031FB4EEA
MTRKEFIKICSLLGISSVFHPTLSALNNIESNNSSNKNDGKVLIIGAGAAGLTAAYKLSQLGIDFQILEASSTYGGRMKIAKDFVDFPIPLGAEWLHVERDVFDDAIKNPSIKVSIKTIGYSSDDYGIYNGEELSMDDMGFGIDQKFIGSSWLNFFEQYILPSVKNKISYNQIVNSIDYSKDLIKVTTQKGKFEADNVIITIPVKILQNDTIKFTPDVPEYKIEAFTEVKVWEGLKVFIEFSEKFYPTAIETKIKPKNSGQKMYYDASYGQNSKHNVLGLFVVGSAALPYLELSDNELIKYILNELDEAFDGKASSSYVKHITQNWSKEPFIEGAYVHDKENWRTIKSLGKSINNKLYFAGTSYTTGDDWGGVHNAIYSGIRAIEEILE